MGKKLLLIFSLFIFATLGTVGQIAEAAQAKPVTYVNKKYKFSLTLPAKWKNSYAVKEEKFNGETWINFYYKKGNKVTDEQLFWILITDRTKAQIIQESIDSGGVVNPLYLGTKNKKSYVYGDKNRYSGDSALTDQRYFDFVNNDAPKIAKTFKFIK